MTETATSNSGLADELRANPRGRLPLVFGDLGTVQAVLVRIGLVPIPDPQSKERNHR